MSGKFLKKSIKKVSQYTLPSKLKKNPGKRQADDTVYHDTDNDRTKQVRRDNDNLW